MTERPNSLAIVTSIISLAHSLELEVVAEGVELEEQAKLLRLLRCDLIQGNLYSPPLPAERIITLLGRSQL
jgi:EAL domain-containing protein (putative c-di-GMP-specific phosphodiesterase class I)